MSKIVNLFDNNLKFKFLFLVFFMVIASFLELRPRSSCTNIKFFGFGYEFSIF